MGKVLPKNWAIVETGDVVNVNSGIGFPLYLQGRSIGKYPFYKVGDISQTFKRNEQYLAKANNYIEEDDLTTLKGKLFPVGAIVFAKIGEALKLNRRAILSETGLVDNNVMGLFPINCEMSKYIYYYYYYTQDLAQFSAGNAVPSVRKSTILTIKFPLPPLAEQQRIITKLDALFGNLEQVKTRLAKIPQLLKNFRQAILTQAVTGKLTEEWRKGKKLGDWKETNLINLIIEKPRNGYSPMGVDYKTPLKSLSLSATTSGTFDGSKIKYLDVEIPKKDSHLWLKNGDILIQRSNSLDYVGTSAIYDGKDDDFIYPDIMMKVQANDKIINTFLNYVLSSSNTKKYFRDNATGTAGNMPKINQGVVSNTPIKYPPLSEQSEIVQRVEHLFTTANSIETKYKTLKTHIDSLPQAILAKAFKGDLVEQLATDGDARDLLEEIKKLKESMNFKKKNPSRRVKL